MKSTDPVVIVPPAPRWLDSDMFADLNAADGRVMQWFIISQQAKRIYEKPILSPVAEQRLIDALHKNYLTLSSPLKHCISYHFDTEKKVTYYSVIADKIPVWLVSRAIFSMGKVYNLSTEELAKMRKDTYDERGWGKPAKPVFPTEYIVCISVPLLSSSPLRDNMISVIARHPSLNLDKMNESNIMGFFKTKKAAVQSAHSAVQDLSASGIVVLRYRLLDTLVDSQVNDSWNLLK